MKSFEDAANDFLKELANVGDAELAPLVTALQHAGKQLDTQMETKGELVTGLLTEYRRIRNEILESVAIEAGVDEDDNFLSPQDG